MGQLLQQIIRQKEVITEVAKRHHAVNLRLFGSVARGEENKQSDVDLLVDFLPGSTLLDQVDLIEELSRLLGRRVDVVSTRALNKYLREKIFKEARAL